MSTLENLNRIGVGKLPGHLGIVITQVGESELKAELVINDTLMAPNGYLHAGTVVTPGENRAGFGRILNLTPPAPGFSTFKKKTKNSGPAQKQKTPPPTPSPPTNHAGGGEREKRKKQKGRGLAGAGLRKKKKRPRKRQKKQQPGAGGARGGGGGEPPPQKAPVAQLDRVSASEAEGRGFESRRAHHPNLVLPGDMVPIFFRRHG